MATASRPRSHGHGERRSGGSSYGVRDGRRGGGGTATGAGAVAGGRAAGGAAAGGGGGAAAGAGAGVGGGGGGCATTVAAFSRPTPASTCVSASSVRGETDAPRAMRARSASMSSAES